METCSQSCTKSNQQSISSTRSSHEECILNNMSDPSALQARSDRSIGSHWILSRQVLRCRHRSTRKHTAEMNRTLVGNYLSDAPEDKLYGNSTPGNAMTAQVFNAQGHIAITAMIAKEQTQEATMLAQAAGKSHGSQNILAQTRPETSEMSTQTELQNADFSVLQQSLHVLGSSQAEEGQEHTSVLCSMNENVKPKMKQLRRKTTKRTVAMIAESIRSR
jgi:hypothetical protein